MRNKSAALVVRARALGFEALNCGGAHWSTPDRESGGSRAVEAHPQSPHLWESGCKGLLVSSWALSLARLIEMGLATSHQASTKAGAMACRARQGPAESSTRSSCRYLRVLCVRALYWCRSPKAASSSFRLIKGTHQRITKRPRLSAYFIGTHLLTKSQSH